MKNLSKKLLYACILGMTMSCSGTSSSSAEAEPEMIDSIPIYQIDGKVNPLEVYEIGNCPKGEEVEDATTIYNPDYERGARITSIDGDNIVFKCKPTLDSIHPRMLIGVYFTLKVPEESGPFDATMRIHYNNVKKPTIIKLHGNAE